MAIPNILLITTHDSGRHFGCYRRPVSSPNIDAFAAEGVRFERYFCTAPQCSPSRAAITTGRYPHRTGVMGLVGDAHEGWYIAPEVPTLARTLSAAGWSSYLWGFQHEHHNPAELGYQHVPLPTHPQVVPHLLADYITPRLCKWLASKPDKPFFASVGFFETHIPFHRQPAAENSFYDNPLPFLPDHPALRCDVGGLNASVQVVDSNLRTVLTTLEDSGLAENTIVIFTTDHGIAFPRAKCSLYDSGIETALMMRWPARLAANRVSSELLSNIDLMPTLLSLLEVNAPAGMDGESFAGVLVGGDYQPRKTIFAEMTYHDEYRPMRCIRTQRHKLIHYFEPRHPWNIAPKDFWQCQAGATPLRAQLDYAPAEYELFDLAVDPYEQHDLLNTHANTHAPALFAELQPQLDQWMQATEDPLQHGAVLPRQG